MRGERKAPPPDYTKFGKKFGKRFLELVQERRNITDTKKALEDRHKEIGAELAEIMEASGQKSVLVEGRPVTLCVGRRSSIDGHKLLEKGVPAPVIAACTVTTTYTYVNTGSAASGELVDA